MPSSTRGQSPLGSQCQVKESKNHFFIHLITSRRHREEVARYFKVTVSKCFPVTHPGGQMDFSQVSGPLMTPPISPATLVHRGSVINQGPMTGRAPTSSSSTTCPSSSSSCLSSISAMSQPSPCSSYQETLYHCLPQTSSSYFPAGSGSSASSYQPALRSALFGIVQHCFLCY